MNLVRFLRGTIYRNILRFYLATDCSMGIPSGQIGASGGPAGVYSPFFKCISFEKQDVKYKSINM